jgi:hypothetical protein
MNFEPSLNFLNLSNPNLDRAQKAELQILKNSKKFQLRNRSNIKLKILNHCLPA